MSTGQNDERREQKREHVRRMLQVPASVCRISTSFTWEVRLIDICRAGVAFVSTTPMEIAEEFVLSFRFDAARDLISVAGKVVYVAPLGETGLRIGARLGAMSEDAVIDIVDFVTSPLKAS